MLCFCGAGSAVRASKPLSLEALHKGTQATSENHCNIRKLKQLFSVVRVTQGRERAQFLYTRKMQPV